MTYPVNLLHPPRVGLAPGCPRCTCSLCGHPLPVGPAYQDMQPAHPGYPDPRWTWIVVGPATSGSVGTAADRQVPNVITF